MRWLPAPPVTRGLVALAAAYVLLTIPLAWHKFLNGDYLPYDWALRIWLADARDFISPLAGKTGVGLFRYLHFLAIAYLAWAAVGPGGARLTTGWRAPGAVSAPLALAGLGLVAVLTVPYAYVDTIKALAPALDAWLLAVMERNGLLPAPGRLGLLQLLHLAALIPLVWAAMGAVWRARATRDWVIAAVPVIRKVGTQSLAVFMVSIVLSRFNGFALDVMGRNVWTTALVNLWGFAVLIATAYSVGWFKGQPWRNARKPQVNEDRATDVAKPTPAE